MLTLVIAVLALAIVAVHIVIVFGAVAAFLRETGLVEFESEVERGRISVIVPARNEQSLLPRLLDSLERQNTNRFELVMVNDRSDDRTAEIMESFRERFPSRVRIVTLTDEPKSGNPKQRALAAGAAAATGDLLLLTDADCSLPVAWVRTMSRPFRNAHVGLVFGPVIPGASELDRDTRWLDRYQAFDQLFRFQYTAAAAGLKSPAGGFGNNMAVRREALRNAGGFEGLRYSVTEDAQLIAQVRESGRWDIQAIRRRGARVIPAPETDVKSLFRQNLRWNTGGFFAPDAKTRASYALVMGYLFLSVLALPFASLQSLIALPALGSFISMLMLGVLAGILNEPGLRYWLWLIPNVLFSMVFYSFVTMMTLFRVPVSWKGRSLSAHSR